MAKNTSNIHLTVELDDQHVPESISWEASESDQSGPQDAHAMILSLWDPKAGNALRIDLWTKEMTVEDMNDFFFQILLSMADTYQRATNNEEIMSDIKHFAREFAEKASKMEQQRQA